MGEQGNGNTRRQLLAGMAGGLVVWALAGGRRAAAQGVNLGTITITWYPVFLYHLPTSMAIERGFLREEGIEVKEIIGARGGGETVRNITEGNLLLGEAAAAAAVLAITRAREALVLVAGGAKSPGDISWVVLPDSPIRKIQDLKGKTMGYTSPGSVTEQLATMCLERAPGVRPDEVKRIAAGGIGEGLALLRKREVDACAMLEPTYSTRAADTRILFYARELVPSYFQTFWLARESFLQKQGDVLRRFLKARQRGLDFILKNPKEAAALWAKLNKQTEEMGMKVLRASAVLEGQYYSDGRFIVEGLKTVEEGMRLSGDIAKDFRIPWRQIVNQSFLAPEQQGSLPG